MKHSDKLRGLVAIHESGLPVLPFIILDRKLDIQEQIIAFMNEHNIDKFCVRSDSLLFEKNIHSILDATLVDIPEIERMLSLANVFVSHPGNIYQNTHSVNAMKDGQEIILEAVGPGFITPDLDKKGLVHEQVILNEELEVVSRKTMVSAGIYGNHIKEKIGTHISRHQKNNSYLVKYPEYIPLNNNELNQIISAYPKITKVADKLGFDNFVISLSFVNMKGIHKMIFWDIFEVKK